MELLDLGLHRLKDLGRPERVWQLAPPGLPRDFPPLQIAGHFPSQPARADDAADRPGTTSSLRWPAVGRGAADHLDRFGRGGQDPPGPGRGRGGRWTLSGWGVAGASWPAWPTPERWPPPPWPPWASISARAMTLVEQLARALGNEPSLLVLDNCEHLVDGCAAVRGRPARRHRGGYRSWPPAGSRWACPVRSPGGCRRLTAPPARPPLAVATLSQYDAVRLFIDRARRARPVVRRHRANAPAVAQICHRLDGIPLALELAAARCRQLSAERIAHDLDDRFRLLTGGARTVLPRHQTLAALDRLEPRPAGSRRKRSRSAGSVCSPGRSRWRRPKPIGGRPGRRRSGRGVRHSQPAGGQEPGRRRRRTADGEPRYRLLETLRAYAANRADTAGELAELRRQSRHLVAVVAEARWPIAHTDPVVDEVELFHDSLKAALDWSLAEPAIGLPLLRYLGRPLLSTGRASDAAGRGRPSPHRREHPQAPPGMGRRRLHGRSVAEWVPRIPRCLSPGGHRPATGRFHWRRLRPGHPQGFADHDGKPSPDSPGHGPGTEDRYMDAYGSLVSAWVVAFHDPRAAAALLDHHEFARPARKAPPGRFADWVRGLVALGWRRPGRLPPVGRQAHATAGRPSWSPPGSSSSFRWSARR